MHEGLLTFFCVQDVEILRFEVDDTGLAKMHLELLEIEEQIKKHAELASALPDS